MNFNEYLLNEIKPFYDDNNNRYVLNEKKIPSVTQILGYVDNQGLIDWANMIGRKGINNKSVLENASQYGTNTHSAIENYLKENYIFTDNASFKSFKLWWDNLHESCKKIEVIGQEEKLVNEYFAGTYDLLLNIDDKIYLVDFKTSNHVGYKYFMQLAAYRYLLYTQKNINIDGCIVLQLGKNKKPKFNEYCLTFSIKEHYDFIENCMKSFMGLLYTYHSIENIKVDFNNIF